MSIRVGILGVGGYGGGEVLRLCATHPQFEVVYASGASTVGKTLLQLFPGIHRKQANLVVRDWDLETLRSLDVIFASLPTGSSKGVFDELPASVKVVDIGGDNRYQPGWTYGLADVWPDAVRKSNRVANPGCFPSASLLAIAPLLKAGLVDLNVPVLIDAKSGVSGAGRGGANNKFGYSEVNEDLMAYGLLEHPHVREIVQSVQRLGDVSSARVGFTPHLVPMTRGILATCYVGGNATTAQCLDAAKAMYADRPFVRVVEVSPHTKWATGSNLAFVSYAAHPQGWIIALGSIDNLGKGAAGQAVQNANLMCGLDESAGLEGSSLWP